jgi:hypothetical protein
VPKMETHAWGDNILAESDACVCGGGGGGGGERGAMYIVVL